MCREVLIRYPYEIFEHVTLTITAVSSEAWAKLRDWASVAGRGRLLLSGGVAHASLETAVLIFKQYICQLEFAILN